LGERRLETFLIEIGGMEYGFAINGILGMDFLIQAGVVLNLRLMTVEFHPG